MASLNIIEGAQTGTHFELAKRPLSVGREAGRDIQIIDSKVSRRHAVIKYEDGRHVIEVANARNGVKINGTRIEERAVLSEGDLVTLGDTVLRYTEAGAAMGNAVNEIKAAGQDSQTLIQ